MPRKSNRVRFDNGRGQTIVGVIETPIDEIRHFALFAHCFTCGKDLKAIVRISRKLAEQGIAVLRFDMTGLGDSQGDFSETNLTTNCQDILAAAGFLSREYQPPELLIGHSLGGTAMTLTSDQIDSARALVTIASPSSTERLADFLERSNLDITTKGEGTVNIGGRNFLLKKQLMNDLRSHSIETTLANLKTPILMYHSPQDDTLPYAWGLKMFEAAQGIKNFITLDGSDHLLVDQEGDVEFVARSMLAWAERYLPENR